MAWDLKDYCNLANSVMEEMISDTISEKYTSEEDEDEEIADIGKLGIIIISIFFKDRNCPTTEEIDILSRITITDLKKDIICIICRDTIKYWRENLKYAMAHTFGRSIHSTRNSAFSGVERSWLLTAYKEYHKKFGEIVEFPSVIPEGFYNTLFLFILDYLSEDYMTTAIDSWILKEGRDRGNTFSEILTSTVHSIITKFTTDVNIESTEEDYDEGFNDLEESIIRHKRRLYY